MRFRQVAGYGALAAALAGACGGRADLGSLAGPAVHKGGAPRSSDTEAGATDDPGSTPDASVTVDATSNADASPGDAGTTDSASCTIVLASQYDQSCKVDADCVAVGQVPSCQALLCPNCVNAAINKNVAARYEAAFEHAFPASVADTACPCPCASGAMCREGKCQVAPCWAPSGDALPACSNAGGQCVYSANETCPRAGPADSCAYSDEVCCLR